MTNFVPFSNVTLFVVVSAHTVAEVFELTLMDVRAAPEPPVTFPVSLASVDPEGHLSGVTIVKVNDVVVVPVLFHVIVPVPELPETVELSFPDFPVFAGSLQPDSVPVLGLPAVAASFEQLAPVVAHAGPAIAVLTSDAGTASATVTRHSGTRRRIRIPLP